MSWSVEVVKVVFCHILVRIVQYKRMSVYNYLVTCGRPALSRPAPRAPQQPAGQLVHMRTKDARETADVHSYQ